MNIQLFSKYRWSILLVLLLLLAACAPEVAPESAGEEMEAGEETETAAAETAPSPAVNDTAALPAIDPGKYNEYEIITLLPPDAIPAIDNPQFLTAAEADDEYEPDELILGVFINGEARAYSVPHLSSHEIVNDTVGGRKISVTW